VRLISILILVVTAFADSIPNQIVCRSKERIRPFRLPAALGASVKRTNSKIRLVTLQDGSNIKSKINKIQEKNPNAVCGPNYLYKRLLTPNDTFYNDIWALPKIGAPSAWDSSTGSTSITVAIIDTGILLNHPDLSANIKINSAEIANNSIDDDLNGYVDDRLGYNTINDNSNANDGEGHGTHVAGTIGAIGNNNLGVTGVCWSCKLLPVKVLDDNGDGTSESVAAGVDYARIRGADIFNLSLGGPSDDPVLESALQSASNAGKLLVFAAGNEGANNNTTPSYPANYSFANSLTVAATNSSDERAGFSNYGTNTVHLAAPGVDILSTYLSNNYAYSDGTSMAAPQVSGALAILRSLGATSTQSRNCILNGVTVVAGLPVSTSGRLNLASAVNLCSTSSATPTPTPTVSPTPTRSGSAIDDPTPVPIPPISFQGTLKGSSLNGLALIKGRIFSIQNQEPVSGTRIKRSCVIKLGATKVKYNKTLTARTSGSSIKDLVEIKGARSGDKVSFRCKFTNPLAPQALKISGKFRWR